MRIIRYEGQPLSLSLGYQHAIEGVPVMEGEIPGQLCVLEGNVQFRETIPLCCFQDYIEIRDGRESPRSKFDGDFPDAYCTNIDFVAKVIDSVEGIGL